MEFSYFGTDGIRGVFGQGAITGDMAIRLGWAFGMYMRTLKPTPKVLVGYDGRHSGIELIQGLCDGLQAAIVGVASGGVLATPVLQHSIPGMGFDGGIMVTASHNLVSDNGFKFFDASGLKISLEAQSYIEARLIEANSICPQAQSLPQSIDLTGAYMLSIEHMIKPISLSGYRLVLDTAHGGASFTSPAILKSTGAQVICIGHQPNGSNINDHIGSEHPSCLQQTVLAHQAFGGIAQDGDGDRVLLVDEKGDIIPGEVILGVLALDLRAKNALKDDVLVTTVQSNLGLDRMLEAVGVRTIRTPVGDRYVSRVLQQNHYALGGESSGHILFCSSGYISDGLWSALQVLNFVHNNRLKLSDLRAYVPLFPQKSIHLPVNQKIPLSSIAPVQACLASIEHQLNGQGRVLMRYSGTENKLRLLVEGPSQEAVDLYLHELSTVLKEHL